MLFGAFVDKKKTTDKSFTFSIQKLLFDTRNMEENW